MTAGLGISITFFTANVPSSKERYFHSACGPIEQDVVWGEFSEGVALGVDILEDRDQSRDHIPGLVFCEGK